MNVSTKHNAFITEDQIHILRDLLGDEHKVKLFNHFCNVTSLAYIRRDAFERAIQIATIGTYLLLEDLGYRGL